jgi:PAS domain S-box-containing protein
MGLKKKTLIVILAAVLAASGLLLSGAALYLKRIFTDLESREIALQSAWAKGALLEEENSLNSIARDWANWDESYYFVLGRNSDYVRDNLNPATLSNIGFDIIRYYDLSGRLVIQAVNDSGKVRLSRDLPSPEFDELLRDRLWERSGIIRTPAGSALAAVWPVKRSDTGGPAVGSIIAARFLSRELTARISQRGHQKISLSEASDTASVRITKTKDTILVSCLIKDIKGHPAARLDITLDNKWSRLNQRLLFSMIAGLLLLSLFLVVCLIFGLDRFILQRITLLSKLSKKVEMGRSRRIAVGPGGDDEIDNLTARLDRMVKALDAEHRNYKLLFDNMLNGFARHRLITDQNGRAEDYEFLEVNHAFEKITGLTRDDIIGKRVSQVMPDFLKGEFDLLAAYGRVALEGRELRMERYCHILDRWFSIVAFRTEPGYFATVFEDITQRKQIQKLLQESEERFRRVAESTELWVWETDARGYYTYSNSAVMKILGYEPQELIGKVSYYDLFAPDTKEEILTSAQETYSRGEPFRDFINPCLHKNGRVVYLQTNGFSIRDDEGNLIGYRGTDRDITLERALQEEREAVIAELQQALENIKTLKGLIPICASCKKVRNDQGYWQQVEEYVSQHTEADFSHGLCDECARKLYPDYFDRMSNKVHNDDGG